MLVIYINDILMAPFNTKIKTNVVWWYLRTMEDHVDGDNIGTMISSIIIINM